ncbi:hypothetical protein ScPMuIL_012924 [Solemya velum]
MLEGLNKGVPRLGIGKTHKERRKMETLLLSSESPKKTKEDEICDVSVDAIIEDTNKIQLQQSTSSHDLDF